MKKKRIICVVLTSVILVMLLTVFWVKNKKIIVDNIFVLVDNSLTRELLEKGAEPRDIIGNEMDSCIYTRYGEISLGHRNRYIPLDEYQVIFDGITKYMREDDAWYFVSENGYAVVPDEGDVLVYFEKNPNNIPLNAVTTVYLDSYDEFSDKQKEMFEYIEEKIVFDNIIDE